MSDPSMTSPPVTQGPVLRRLIRQMAGRKLWMMSGGIIAFIATLSSIALLMTAGWFITASALAGLAAGAVGAISFNFHFPGAMIRGFALSRTVGRYAERVVTHEATFRALTDLRVWLFGRLIPLVPGRLNDLRLGDVLTRLTSDIDQLDAIYLRLLVPSGMALVMAVLVGTVMGLHVPLMAVVTIGCLGMAGVMVPMLTNRLGQRVGEALVTHRSELRAELTDGVDGIAELLVYGADQQAQDKIAQEQAALATAQCRMAGIAGLGTALTTILGGMALVGALYVGLGAYANEQISGPVLAMLIFGVLAIFEVVTPLPLAYQILGQTRAAGRRILALVDAPPSLSEPDEAHRQACPETGTLVFDTVRFTYPGADRPALNDLNLTLEPGTHLGIVGHSGAGKSTLLALLLKTAQAEAGSITWDGVSLDRIQTDDLYQQIGVLTQSPRLFSTSIRDNLLLGNPYASDDDLLAVCDAVGLGPFIAGLPQGLDTWLGEAGTKVSGGQARRLTLARLLLKDPKLVLLDEPTEGLDPATEKQVIDTIARVFEGRTVIIITHRLAPLAVCDRVISLDRGAITADQPGDEFLTQEKARLDQALSVTKSDKPQTQARTLRIEPSATVESPAIAETQEPAAQPQTHWLARPVYFGIGFVCLILGLIGVVVPGMPTTIFMIIALWAFARSSKRFHDWLWNHPRFGPTLAAWGAYRVVPRKAKWAAAITMAASIALMIAVSVPWQATAFTAVICAGVLAYILPKAERPPLD